MGRGRTTTGMVIATLIYINRIGTSGEFLLAFHSLILTVVALLSLGSADGILKNELFGNRVLYMKLSLTLLNVLYLISFN